MTKPDAITLFLDAAARHPDRTAIQSRSATITYAALETRVRRTAERFAATPAAKILIALPRGVDAYAAMLGAGLAGGFYVPLNEASPPDKQRRIARLLQPDIIVAPRSIAEPLAAETSGARIIDPEEPHAGPPLCGPGTRHHTAYVIFTSGSTGEPKGVVIPRTALDHYVNWIHTSGSVQPQDVVSQFNNLAFDVSVLDIYGALCCGAVLVPVGSRGDRLMPARAIARERITVWSSVPSVVDLMQTAQQLTHANLGSVRLFTLAGEKLLRPQVEALFAACPDCIVQNAYGPTEATVTVTEMRMTRDDFASACHGSNTAIGPPTAGMAIPLINGPHADEGEMVLVGPQLADGYWNDPERTARAFRPVTVDGHLVRGFHTGDWAVRRGENLFFEERIDLQVKIRGYRIELDEVAAAIHACGWPAVCVFKRGDALAALVELGADRNLDAAALQAALAERIEAYAVPTHIAAVPALPRNENDKVDRTQAAALLETLLMEQNG